MAIGRTFKESLQNACAPSKSPQRPRRDGKTLAHRHRNLRRRDILPRRHHRKLSVPTERIFYPPPSAPASPSRSFQPHENRRCSCVQIKEIWILKKACDSQLTLSTINHELSTSFGASPLERRSWDFEEDWRGKN